jgi:hypothetical protein
MYGVSVPGAEQLSSIFKSHDPKRAYGGTSYKRMILVHDSARLSSTAKLVPSSMLANSKRWVEFPNKRDGAGFHLSISSIKLPNSYCNLAE